MRTYPDFTERVGLIEQIYLNVHQQIETILKDHSQA